MRDDLERLLRAGDIPSTERAERLWAEYCAGGPAGDAAFATLLAWYGHALYSRIWGFTRSDAAEDVFQEVIAKLHQARKKLETFEQALRWLRTVAVRQCIDAHRRTTRRRAREASWAIHPRRSGTSTAQVEIHETLTVALAKLTADQREAIALVFFEGLDRQDAATVMGVNRDTLTKRIGEALERLKVLVQAPALLAIGGLLGIESALSASPPVIASKRLAELAGSAIVSAETAGPKLGKVAAVIAIGVVCAGAAAGAGWLLTREPQPAPSPTLPTVSATPIETLQARNLRVLEYDIVPRVVEALRGLDPGGGEVRVSGLQARDTRVFFDIEVAFKDPPPLLTQLRFRFEYDTRDRWLWIQLDEKGTGAFHRIDPSKPIVLLRIKELNYELTLKSDSLNRAVVALNEFPTDPRTATEAAEHRDRLLAAIQPYLGEWHRGGDPTRPVRIILPADAGVRTHVHFQILKEYADGTPLNELALLPDGRLVLPIPGGQTARLSADGTTLELTPFGERWQRPP